MDGPPFLPFPFPFCFFFGVSGQSSKSMGGDVNRGPTTGGTTMRVGGGGYDVGIQ